MLADQLRAKGVRTRSRDARLHLFGAELEFRNLKGGSSQDPSWSFPQEMCALGHAAAKRWLAANHTAVSSRSLLDLAAFTAPQIAPPAAS